MRSVRLRAAAALGVVLLIGVTGTYASWTDSVEVSGVTITSGSLDLRVNGFNNITGFGALDLTNMVPGNSTAAVLTVSNAGTVPLTYRADASATNQLGGALTVKVTGAATVTGSGASETCSGGQLANTGSAFGGNLVGTPAAPRSLTSGASETLCIQATLPATASNALQGGSTAVAFSFQADQVPG